MSLNIDLSQMLQIASDLFNAFWPIAAIIAGFILGFGIVRFIIRELRSALPS